MSAAVGRIFLAMALNVPSRIALATISSGDLGGDVRLIVSIKINRIAKKSTQILCNTIHL